MNEIKDGDIVFSANSRNNTIIQGKVVNVTSNKSGNKFHMTIDGYTKPYAPNTCFQKLEDAESYLRGKVQKRLNTAKAQEEKAAARRTAIEKELANFKAIILCAQ